MLQNDPQGNRNSEPSFGFEPFDLPHNIKVPGSPNKPEPVQQNYQTNQVQTTQSQTGKNIEDTVRKGLGDLDKKLSQAPITKSIKPRTIGIVLLIIGVLVFFWATSEISNLPPDMLLPYALQAKFHAQAFIYRIFQLGGVLAAIIGGVLLYVKKG